jgi:large subunit ribosomal protein L18
MGDITNRRAARVLRHKRVRRRISGTEQVPRLAVFKSSRHTYCQVIDDIRGHTLASVCTLTKGARDEFKGMKPVEVAKKLGALIAERAKEKGISRVVFDRGGFPYRGRVKALAEAARAGGLDF